MTSDSVSLVGNIKSNAASWRIAYLDLIGTEPLADDDALLRPDKLDDETDDSLFDDRVFRFVKEKLTSSVTKRDGREKRGDEENPIDRLATTTKTETTTKPITMFPNPPFKVPFKVELFEDCKGFERLIPL